MSETRRIVFAGSPDFALPTLDRLLRSHHRIVAVLTQQDRPAGRGRHARASPVKSRAQAEGVQVLQPATLKDEAVQTAIGELDPDLMVVVAYGLLLPATVLAIPRRGCVNVHASLLPRWRGAAPVQAAILAGDREIGVSLMQMDAGLDTGPVYAQERVSIGPHETAGELQDRLAIVGADVLLASLDAVLDGTLTPRPQPEAGVTYAGRISKADARIDWHRSARDIDRQIRAYNPWPVAESMLDGLRLRCWSGLPLPDGGTGAGPGEVLAAGPDGVDVQTGDGILRLTSVQLPGRQRVAASAFANGYSVLGKRLDA